MENRTPPVTTASTQVEQTYYGQPVIKAPHWRWLVVFYFFFGGLAGASFTIATVADLVTKDAPIARLARYLAFGAFLPCGPLLILDLGRPERALNMFRIVKLKSPMSLGSWALNFFGLFSSLAAGLQILGDLRGREASPRLRRAVGILGLPFSVFLSGYTGILLAATNIPLWWRASPFLAPTFISSAYCASLSSLSLLLGFDRRAGEPAERGVARAEIACAAMELGFLTAMVIRLGPIGKPLTRGRLGMIFWPVTYFGGIILPLATNFSRLRRTDRRSSASRNLPAILTLLGGFSLRALMIFAGRKSANIPEDYFFMTRANANKDRPAPPRGRV